MAKAKKEAREFLEITSVAFSGKKLGQVFTRMPKLVSIECISDKDFDSIMNDPAFVVKMVER